MYKISFEKMIPSADVRAYCEKVGRLFTLSEQATLVFNNPLLDFDEKDKLLREIAELCDKDSAADKKLKKEIVEQLEFDEKIKRIFYEPENGAFYSISWEYSDEWCDDDFYFSTFEKCRDYVKDELKDKDIISFRVNKNYLDTEYLADKNQPSYKYINANFSKDFVLSEISSLGFGDEDFTECVPRVNNRFEDNYVEVPHPFRAGDIVKSMEGAVHYSRSTAEGIVALPRTDEDCERGAEHCKKLKERGLIDSTDISMNVEYLCCACGTKRGSWSFDHNHPYIPTVVYATLPEGTEQDKSRKELFDVASELMKGEGSLEVFMRTMRAYNEKY